jgi:hypothetical protein
MWNLYSQYLKRFYILTIPLFSKVRRKMVIIAIHKKSSQLGALYMFEVSISITVLQCFRLL